jgi:anthranilate phosphoribosyltransferase
LDRGVKALVVRGNDGCDEISLADSTRVWDITTGVLQETLISPRDFGVHNFDSQLLRGGDRRRNAELTRKVLGGELADESPANNSRADSDAEQVAAIRLSVAVNAAAALVAVDAVSNPHYAQNTPLVDRINRFLPDTTKVLAGSTAWNLMLRWIEASRDVASRS